MKRRIPALALALAVLFTTALAADVLPTVKNDYKGYGDVAPSDYYAAAAEICYKTGLMEGYGDGLFHANSKMPVYQVAALAARLHAAFRGRTLPQQVDGESWYNPYLRYLKANNISVPEPVSALATRLQFFRLMSAAVPDEDLAPINAISSLPDTDDPDVLRFYNAGILTGMDKYGTFEPDGQVTRGQCATMMARILQPDQRKTFTPQVKPVETSPAAGAPAGSAAPDTAKTVLSVNGTDYSLGQFVAAMDEAIYATDRFLYVTTGNRLSWNESPNLELYFLNQTLDALVEDAVLGEYAQGLGCTVDQLKTKLVPAPDRAMMRAYVAQEGLAAKHILVATQEEAKAIIKALQQKRTLAAFDNLMVQYSADPGSTAYPNGYLFVSGQMVAPFENAVKSLDPYAFTAEPVQSDYGYHVILRLDPLTLFDAMEETDPQYTSLIQSYQDYVYDAVVDELTRGASVTVDRDALVGLDVRQCYEAYLKWIDS